MGKVKDVKRAFTKMRLASEVVLLVMSLVVGYMLFYSDALIDGNPLYLVLVTMTKVSIAILHWHVFRKLYFSKVLWKKEFKDVTNEDVMVIGSFFLFIFVYTGSYS